jgi:hypothetical protein
MQFISDVPLCHPQNATCLHIDTFTSLFLSVIWLDAVIMALSIYLGGFSEITSFLKGTHYCFWRMCRHVLCQARYHFSATQNLWQKILFVHKRKERFATGDLPIGCPSVVDFILMSNGRTVAFYSTLHFLISLSNVLYTLCQVSKGI